MDTAVEMEAQSAVQCRFSDSIPRRFLSRAAAGNHEAGLFLRLMLFPPRVARYAGRNFSTCDQLIRAVRRQRLSAHFLAPSLV